MRETGDLIERERNNRGVVLFFSSELIGHRGKLAESNEDKCSRVVALRSS